MPCLAIVKQDLIDGAFKYLLRKLLHTRLVSIFLCFEGKNSSRMTVTCTHSTKSPDIVISVVKYTSRLLNYFISFVLSNLFFCLNLLLEKFIYVIHIFIEKCSA